MAHVAPSEPYWSKKMPLLFYLPMIVWMGFCGIAQDELRPAKAKAKVPRRG
jgi:hypothetical protein